MSSKGKDSKKDRDSETFQKILELQVFLMFPLHVREERWTPGITCCLIFKHYIGLFRALWYFSMMSIKVCSLKSSNKDYGLSLTH